MTKRDLSNRAALWVSKTSLAKLRIYAGFKQKTMLETFDEVMDEVFRIEAKKAGIRDVDYFIKTLTTNKKT